MAVKILRLKTTIILIKSQLYLGNIPLPDNSQINQLLMIDFISIF